MCGRFLLESDIEDLLTFYKIANDVTFKIQHTTVYPTQQSPVIIKANEENRMGLMEWGFTIEGIKRPIINSRVEGIFQKKSFKKSVESRRCIIPATGFFEWQNKMPHLIKDTKHPFLSFAGIYQKILDPQGLAKWQFSILTRSANATLSEIHDRMPLILEERYVDEWLSAKTDLHAVHDLLDHDIATLEITH